MMHCAGEHLGHPCSGPPSIRCGACGAARYCSPSHQRLHWPEHKRDCKRYEEQLRKAVILHDFPFTFTHESTFMIDNGTMSICTFLQKIGVHMSSIWLAECGCSKRLSSSMSDLDKSEENDISGWNLPSFLCPCTDSSAALWQLSSWSDYYAWRALPFDSPVSIVLHWPLTLYHTLNVAYSQGFPNSRHFRIHFLGPDKELNQLGVFAELRNLLGYENISIDFIGTAVPCTRNFQQLEFKNPLKCSDYDCDCKSSSVKHKNNSISIKIWKGLYHDVYKELANESTPDFIFAPNAGLAAFSSWLPTLELINELKIPTIFTDFCEEAAILASNCLESVIGSKLTIPVQVNPFRQPMTPSNKTLDLPTYSNCFFFGIA